jgi:hypothetical protein
VALFGGHLAKAAAYRVDQDPNRLIAIVGRRPQPRHGLMGPVMAQQQDVQTAGHLAVAALGRDQQVGAALPEHLAVAAVCHGLLVTQPVYPVVQRGVVQVLPAQRP